MCRARRTDKNRGPRPIRRPPSSSYWSGGWAGPGQRTTIAAQRAAPTGEASGTKRRQEGQSTTEAETPAANPAQPSDRVRRPADVDSWATLLEQLMEAPDERAPAERKHDKGE